MLCPADFSRRRRLMGAMVRRLAAVVGSSMAITGVASQPRGALFDEAKTRTIFAFDQASIPFPQSLRLELRKPEKYPANPVVRRGPAGSPDSWAVQFYGSIIRERGKFRMWYVAAGDDRTDKSAPRSARWRPASAPSTSRRMPAPIERPGAAWNLTLR